MQEAHDEQDQHDEAYRNAEPAALTFFMESERSGQRLECNETAKRLLEYKMLSQMWEQNFLILIQIITTSIVVSGRFTEDFVFNGTFCCAVRAGARRSHAR